MKKYLLFILFFMFLVNVSASNYTDVYISKRDIDDKEFVNDSSFAIYDWNNNIIDSWITKNDVHVVSLEFGDYKLVETPILNDEPIYYLSNYYNISVDNDRVMEFILYNKKVNTPKNLGISNNYIYIGTIFVFIGILIIISRKFYYS